MRTWSFAWALVLGAFGCSSQVTIAGESSGGANGGTGPNAFAWRFDARPDSTGGSTDMFSIADDALYVLVGEVARSCADPYLLSDPAICTSSACTGPAGWQLEFVIPPGSQAPGVLDAGSDDLHMAFDWAHWDEPASSHSWSSGVDDRPYGAGDVEVVSIDASEVVVRFAGLEANYWASSEAHQARTTLHTETFHAIRTCR